MVIEHALTTYCGDNDDCSNPDRGIPRVYVDIFDSDALVDDDSENRKIAKANYVEATPLSESDYASNDCPE